MAKYLVTYKDAQDKVIRDEKQETTETKEELLRHAHVVEVKEVEEKKDSPKVKNVQKKK